MRATLFLLCITFFTILPLSLSAQKAQVTDLKNDWKIYTLDRYEPFSKHNGKISTIYFTIEVNKYPSQRLIIRSSRQAQVFVNGMLAGNNKNFNLDVDSLSKAYASVSLLIGIYQPNLRKNSIQTFMQSSVQLDDSLQARTSTAFRDFAVIGMLILMIMLIVITRLNPKLASDYFSVTKIFSMREGDDSQVYTRITSSTNILFYVYSSLMLSYYLLIIFQFVERKYPVASIFHSTNFHGIMGQWLWLSVIVLGIFFLKIILVFGLSYLFGVNEVAGIHFFNWVRLLLVFFGALTIMLFIYFISHGYSETFHSFLLKLFAYILGSWMILIFLKLSGKMSASMFHLFSYLCATELIPFLITIKVLYN